MAFKLVSSLGGAYDPALYQFTGTGRIPLGSVVRRTTSGEGRGYVTVAANTDGGSEIVGVAASAVIGANSYDINVIPIISGPGGQLWEADCANNTASGQRLVRNGLSSADVLNNSTTDIGTGTGIFMNVREIGAVGDKRMLGYFCIDPNGYGK